MKSPEIEKKKEQIESRENKNMTNRKYKTTKNNKKRKQSWKTADTQNEIPKQSNTVVY